MPLVVGFDLDLTLVDSRPGIAAVYRALSAETSVFIDADAAVTRLGPPLDEELARWFPEAHVAPMADRFRALYPSHAVAASPALPGVRESISAVRARSGRVIVITGKYAPNARLHLNHLDLVVDEVVGWAWAETKTTALLEHGVGVYVGDHPADMRAAVAGGAAAVGVTTGDWGPDDLTSAGADIVLADLRDFPAWLNDYAASLRGRHAGSRLGTSAEGR
ncbi:HAD family hydrolase [Luedemannella flava]|uniref:HAD family hydrolase n=1 Tax=Luedemannella flava TaxID=349316 RepID=A0ABN2MIC7_9ACTN